MDTIAEINELARIANAIQTVAAGGTATPALTVADLTAAGIANVTADNLTSVIAAIAAGNDNGTQTQTLAQLQTLVNGLDTAATALGDFAQANTTGLASATGTLPDLAAYTAAGVTGVNSGTFGAGTAGFAAAGVNSLYVNATGSAYLGDTNRDGLSDVAFSNYLTGQVFVKFGTATQVSTQAIDATTVAASTGKGFVVNGLSTTLVTYSDGQGTRLAVTVASAGDVNGDGYADMLVMSPGNSAAYVIYGQANGSVADLDVGTMTSTQGFKISVSNAAWKFGMSGATIGDVNGDGYSDVVIGEPNEISQGGAVIVFGGATGAHGNIDATSGVTSGGWATQLSFAGLTYDGTNAVGGMGIGLGSSAGDVNGDGLSDFSISGKVGFGSPYIIYGSTTLSSLSLNPLLQGSSLTGTTAAERLLGTSGNDTLSGGGGADAISAGAGNDTVLVHDASFLRVDGGLGVDTLKLDATASAINLDFTANGLGGKIYGFENIDLTGGGNNSLKLTVQDVLAQGNTVDTTATAFNEAHLMVISGNAGDTLAVSNTASLNPGVWSAGTALAAADRTALTTLGYQFVTGDSYTAYSNGLATLIVDNAVTYQVL